MSTHWEELSFVSSLFIELSISSVVIKISRALKLRAKDLESLTFEKKKYEDVAKLVSEGYRYSNDAKKQVEIFRDLKEELPQFEFVVCQEQTLSKNEYHNLLGEAKVVFSANLQETLGISWYEGALVNAIPMMPDRLSYSEMAIDDFKYPSVWTESFESYKINKDKVVAQLVNYVENYESYLPALLTQTQKLKTEFFDGRALYKGVTNGWWKRSRLYNYFRQ